VPKLAGKTFNPINLKNSRFPLSLSVNNYKAEKLFKMSNEKIPC
jgi:hypothetical protein